jgi:archaellum biogenesis protein FlaJ (TadC family)
MRDNKTPRSSRSIPLPKEHGSWAMFSVPLIIGLAVAGTWQWRSALLIFAALGLFMLRFPIDTMIKTRKRPTTDRAWLIRWAGVYGSIAVICGGWLVAVDRLYGLIGFGVIGAALLVYHWWLVDRRKEMSATGELAGIFGLALGAPLAYYTASGQIDSTALALWIVNALYFGGTVFYIKLKVRQQPKEPAPDRMSERLVKAKACLSYQSSVLTLVILLVAFQRLPALAALAFVPMTLKVLYGAARWQDRKSLSLPRLGMIEMAHSALFAVLIIAAF